MSRTRRRSAAAWLLVLALAGAAAALAATTSADAGRNDPPRGAGTGTDYGKGKGLVMGYYDGNTVTALWNYAQAFAMSDNSFGTVFGPSTPGALNLVSGQTHGAVPPALATPFGVDTANGTVIGDPQPANDMCSTRETVTMTGRNVGDLLNAKNVTWGWFQGGFDNCAQTHAN